MELAPHLDTVLKIQRSITMITKESVAEACYHDRLGDHPDMMVNSTGNQASSR